MNAEVGHRASHLRLPPSRFFMWFQLASVRRHHLCPPGTVNMQLWGLGPRKGLELPHLTSLASNSGSETEAHELLSSRPRHQSAVIIRTCRLPAQASGRSCKRGNSFQSLWTRPVFLSKAFAGQGQRASVCASTPQKYLSLRPGDITNHRQICP